MNHSAIFKYMLAICMLFIIGCGADGPITEVNQPEELMTRLKLQVPKGIQQQGQLTIRSEQGQIISSSTVNSLADSFEIPESTRIDVEFVADSNVTHFCQAAQGCGAFQTSNVADINQNGLIDLGEALDVVPIYSARFHSVPGVNLLYLSPFSHVMRSIEDQDTDFQFDAYFRLHTLAVSNGFHLSKMNSEEQLAMSILSQQFNDSFFYLGHDFTEYIEEINNLRSNSNIKIENSILAEWLKLTALNIDPEITIWNEQPLSTEDKSALKNYRQRLINGSFGFDFSTAAPLSSTIVTGQDFLTHWRDILALFRHQQDTELLQIKEQTDSLAQLINSTGDDLLTFLPDLLPRIVAEYSPLENTVAGQYQFEGLNVEYSSAPLSWDIEGIKDNISTQVSFQIPSWRISSSRGDKAEGRLQAEMESSGQQLKFNDTQFSIVYDPIDDPFNQTKPETFVSSLSSEFVLQSTESAIQGQLYIDANRIQNPELTYMLPLVYIQMEQTPLIASLSLINVPESAITENRLSAASILIDFPLTGSTAFKLSTTNQIEQGLNIEKGQFNLLFNNNTAQLEVDLTTPKQETLTIKSEQGFWLEVFRNDKEYTGGLYYGESKLGSVKAVRGLPGILFNDGTFESLF